MNVEIGGGTLLTNGFTNLDPVHGLGNFKRYAQDTPWPLGDNSVDKLRASHVMEHIPAGMDQRVKVMNEAHRVLKRGGTFEIIVPLLVGTWHAIADPTHVSFWVKESFHYFDGLFAANAHYGISLWETVSLEVVNGWEGHWIGRKP
jgi:ubiquinone/menaquinone biosynthesis C-methylase UbiE